MAQSSIAGGPSAARTLQLAGLLLLLALMAWEVVGGGLTGLLMNQSSRRVAERAISKYHIAANSGQWATACFEAGVVAHAYLDLKDAAGFRRWKAVEAECEMRR